MLFSFGIMWSINLQVMGFSVETQNQEDLTQDSSISSLNAITEVSQVNNTIESVEMTYSSYWGGKYEERPSSITVDSEGNIILASASNSGDFPIQNAMKDSPTGPETSRRDEFHNDDVVVSKFTPDGQSVIFSTFIGGNGSENVYNVHTDSNDNIVIVGWTQSPDFPTVNAYNENRSDTFGDIFVMKLSPDGQTILFSTYLAGLSFFFDGDFVLDSSDNIIIGASTIDVNYPITNAYQDTNVSLIDAVITKLSADGQSVIFSTYFGGNNHEAILSLTLDNDENIVFSGQTGSNESFPLVNPIVSTLGESLISTFVGKMSADGQSLLFSSYVGDSNGATWANDVATDADNNIIMVGETNSTEFLLVNAWQTEIYNESTFPYSDIFRTNFFDAIVVKINNDDYSVNFSTRIGGSEFDGASTVAVDQDQNIVVGGAAYSFDFPTTANALSQHRIYWDGFVAIFSPDGQTAQFLTVLGGGESDFINDLVIIESNDTHDAHILIAGQTASMDFPTLQGVQLNYAFLSADALNQPFDCFFAIIAVERPQPTTTTEIPGFEVLFALIAIAFLKMTQKQIKRKK
jgi:hypothetical protein